MKLFAVYIGGEFPGANIEVHDMRFVVARSIAETHDELKRQWWGTPNTLHIDCWAELTQIDGYEIELRPEPFVGSEKLYYINLGGYDGGEFLEKHKNVFIVASNVGEAKRRALKEARSWSLAHRDQMYEAEQAFALCEVGSRQRLHLHLTKTVAARELTFTCNYTPLRSIRKPKSGAP
jgi:hypothetical protein